MRKCRLIARLAYSLILLVGFVPNLRAQMTASLDDKVIAANRELDRRLLEAHELKDADMYMGLFSEGPDAFFIEPGGTVHKTRSAIRGTFVAFFASLESIRGEIKDISYLPAGEGVIAVGTVIYHRKPMNAPADQRTVVWTDYRRMEGGRWVYVFRHAHWPLAANRLGPLPK